MSDIPSLLAQVESLQNELSKAQVTIKGLQETIDQQSAQLARDSHENERMLKELRLSEYIVERSPVILFRRLAGARTNDEDPPLEYISNNIQQFGYTPEQFLSGEIEYSDIVHPDDHIEIDSTINNYADIDAEEYTMVYRCVTKGGETRWVEDQTMVVRDEHGNKTHNQGIIIDITERKIAEDQLRKNEEKFRRIVETTTEGFVLMDQDFIIIDLNDSFCRMLGYSAKELIGTRPFDLVSDDFKEVLRPQYNDIKNLEIRNFEIPLTTKDNKDIVVLIHGNPLRDDTGTIIGHMSFITDITEQKTSLILAGEVQKSLLPQAPPQLSGFDIAGHSISCDEIGGDYFDYIWRESVSCPSLGVVVGDLSGHGVDAALLMTTARAFLKMSASQTGTVAEIISAMNRHLTQDVLETDRFMTLFYISLCPDRKSMSWVRAGHDPALLYDPHSNTFEELKGDGIALGIIEDTQYTEHHRENLKDGQVIAIATDGIWESFNLQGQMFGKERLQQIIAANHKRSAAQIIDQVYEQLRLFSGAAKAEDDTTLVIIKVVK